MLTSAFVLISLIPLQATLIGKSAIPLNTPLAVAAFVDTAKILGLPKFKLRDANGNLYSPHKAMMSEPYSQVQQHAGQPTVSEVTLRKAHIQSYVKR